MRTQTAFNKRRDALSKVISMISHARAFSTPASVMDKRASEIMAELRGCPVWVTAYVQGYYEAMRAALYQDGSLVHGGTVNGVFYSTHPGRDDYYGKHGIEPSAYADNGLVKSRGHYWAHSLKPFFVSEDGVESADLEDRINLKVRQLADALVRP